MEENVFKKGYKAFKPGLVCDPNGNAFHYAENTVFEMEEDAEVCKRGFHFCVNPMDVLDYYPLVNDDGTINEFAKVEALDKCVTDDEKKYATRKIRIGAKIDFPKLVQAAVEFDYSLHEIKNGDCYSKKKNDKIGSSGNSAQIGSSGDSAQIGSSGKNAVVCCAGDGCIAKAKTGSWITLSEWKYIGVEYTPVCVKTEKVDGARIKEDVYYKLVDGEFTEVEV